MRPVLVDIPTSGSGLYKITELVRPLAKGDGIISLFLRHTSCSLLIQENADPDVQTDLKTFFERLVPSADDGRMSYLTHTHEGPDDMPAHIKAALLPVSLTIPVIDGKLALGAWQGIFLFEHRSRAHLRQIAISMVGT